MTRRVVFIGHEGSRTGAPILLLHVVRWMRDYGDCSCEVVLMAGGDLVEEYRRIVPCTVLRPLRLPVSPTASFRSLRLFRRAIERFCDRVRTIVLCRCLRRRWRREGVDVFYLNSVGSGNLLRLCRGIPASVITHIHELSLGMMSGIRAPALADLRIRSAAVIAASGAVKRALTDVYGFPVARVHQVYAAAAREQSTRPAASRAEVRHSLGIEPDDIVVGMCGTVEWRKGVDLFVALAKTVRRTVSGKAIHFLWVGGGQDDEMRADRLALRFGLSDDDMRRIHFVGATSDVVPFFGVMDIFALTSREDPFPLVHLEAAHHGLPIVCFAGAGGAEEWVGEGAGFTVPYGDVSAMAAKVRMLADDAALRASMGAIGARTVAERFTIEKTAPQILQVIRSV